MRIINPKEVPTRDLHQYILGSVAPRPIAFASTIDENGVANIAPYSFFNAFSSNPPILVFSSNRKVADNTTKDTLHNIKKNGEVVINVVNYSIVRQMAVASISFPSEVSEFDKSGLTPVKSDLVKPFRIKESPVHYECRVKDIITLGESGGAGHLIICDVLRMYIDEEILDERNRIDPNKIDLVGRLGRAYYTRVKGDSIFTVVQSVVQITIGHDQLPEHVKNSRILTGNDIGQLAGLKEIPSKEALAAAKDNNAVRMLLEKKGNDLNALHSIIQSEIKKGNLEFAGALAFAWKDSF